MVSHCSKVQERRRDKLVLEEYFVCFITAPIVVATSFQKGQFIIEVDERRHGPSHSKMPRLVCS